MPDKKCRTRASDLNFSGMMLTCFWAALLIALVIPWYYLIIDSYSGSFICSNHMNGALFIPFLCSLPWKKTSVFSPLQISVYITLSFYIACISECNYIHNIRIQQLSPKLYQSMISYFNPKLREILPFWVNDFKRSSLSWETKKELKCSVWPRDADQLVECSLSMHSTLGSILSTL